MVHIMQLRKLLKRIFSNQKGATAIEYALIASLVSVAIVGGVGIMGNQVANTTNQVSSTLDNPSGNTPQQVPSSPSH